MSKRKMCRKCNGNMEYRKSTPGMRCFTLFCMAGISMWIPVLGWILAPILLIAAVFGLFGGTKYRAKCNDCGFEIVITKEHYEEIMGGR